MTILYTPTTGTPYNFERGIGDTLKGAMPTFLTASYRSKNIALLEGTMSIKLASTSSPFQMQCTLNDSEFGVDADTTADAKFDLLKALEGTYGTLENDGLTATGVQLKNVTKTGRVASHTAYPIAASTHRTVTCTILFEKQDA